MVEYVKESWQIFLANLNEIAGTRGALALVFLFAVFLVFWKISSGFGSQKND